MFASYYTAICLIPLLPFAAGIVCALLPASMKRASFALAVSSLAVSTVLAFAFLAAVLRTTPVDGVKLDTFDFAWLTAGSTPLMLGVVLNPLTALMVAMVSFVSLLIFIYSHGYMHADKNYARFFAFLAMFAGAMLGLCVSNSLVMLFVSW